MEAHKIIGVLNRKKRLLLGRQRSGIDILNGMELGDGGGRTIGSRVKRKDSPGVLPLRGIYRS